MVLIFPAFGMEMTSTNFWNVTQFQSAPADPDLMWQDFVLPFLMYDFIIIPSIPGVLNS